MIFRVLLSEFVEPLVLVPVDPPFAPFVGEGDGLAFPPGVVVPVVVGLDGESKTVTHASKVRFVWLTVASTRILKYRSSVMS